MRPFVTRLREQAAHCLDLGSPLYEALLVGAADDYEAGGPTRALLAGEDTKPAGSMPSLRLTGALHRMVLERKAPELATHFPSVGGDAGVEGAWDAALRLIEAEPAAIAARLALPVQTNEVGRAAALLVGIIHAVKESGVRQIRLLEVGASAGLTMRLDRFRIGEGADGVGPADSPVQLERPWAAGPPDLSTLWEIVERRGCDPSPIDPLSTDGRLTLTSYVWADQTHRLERLRGALQLAESVPAPVERSTGSAWLQQRLSEPTDAMTIVWHSVVMQYMSPEERARIDAVLASADLPAPLWRLGYEPARLESGEIRFQLSATEHRGKKPGKPKVIAHGEGHGPPITVVRT